MQQQKERSPEEMVKEYTQHKQKLVKKYGSLRSELEYATDVVEEGWIQERRERLAEEIKHLAAEISRLETEMSNA